MQEYNHEYADTVRHVPLPIEKQLGVWPLHAGRNIAKPNYKVGPRMNDYYSIHVVVEGRLWLRDRQRSYHLGAGDLFCMFPHEVYEYGILDPGDPLRLTWVAIDGPSAEQLLGLTEFHPDRPVIPHMSVPATPASLIRLYDELKRTKPVSGLTHLSLMLDLVGKLSHTKETPPAAPQSKPDWVERSVSFIQIHYKESLTVQQVAEWIGMSRAHFSKSFAHHQGMPPSKYIERLRMEEAVSLLTASDLSVTEIAYTLGYIDIYSFTRAFKKHAGRSPTAYRKRRSV